MDQRFQEVCRSANLESQQLISWTRLDIARPIYIYIYMFILFLSRQLPCYLLHFGAKISDLHVICCILELKSLICMPTSLSAFGFWFLALVSLGFSLLAVGFTWPLAFVGFYVTCHVV